VRGKEKRVKSWPLDAGRKGENNKAYSHNKQQEGGGGKDNRFPAVSPKKKGVGVGKGGGNE